MTPRLAVIGAGAKAVAVAAKAEALREVGAEAPEIVAIERADIAANWQILLGIEPTVCTGSARARRRMWVFRTDPFWLLAETPSWMPRCCAAAGSPIWSPPTSSRNGSTVAGLPRPIGDGRPTCGGWQPASRYLCSATKCVASPSQAVSGSSTPCTPR